MNSLLSSVWLRTQLCDTTAQFQALNSTELPDGATVFNRQDETLWRLDKTAGASFDATLQSNVLQKPNDGTPARWFAEQVDGGSPYQFSGYAEAAVAVTMTSNQWNALGSTAGTFTGTSGTGSHLFTQNPTTSQIVYNGPPRTVLVTMSASINNGIAATPIAMHGVIALSGDVAIGSSGAQREKGEMVVTAPSNVEFTQIVVERVVQLTPGATLQLMFRNATNGDDIVVDYYQVNIAPL